MSGKCPFDRSVAEYVYVLVRKDLPIAHQTVQAIHAGMAAIHRFGGLTDATRLALLSVKDGIELESWMEKLSAKAIPFEPFFEPDHEMGYSALATAPIDAKAARCMRTLELWNPHGSSTDFMLN